MTTTAIMIIITDETDADDVMGFTFWVLYKLRDLLRLWHIRRVTVFISVLLFEVAVFVFASSSSCLRSVSESDRSTHYQSYPGYSSFTYSQYCFRSIISLWHLLCSLHLLHLGCCWLPCAYWGFSVFNPNVFPTLVLKDKDSFLLVLDLVFFDNIFSGSTYLYF